MTNETVTADQYWNELFDLERWLEATPDRLERAHELRVGWKNLLQDHIDYTGSNDPDRCHNQLEWDMEYNLRSIKMFGETGPATTPAASVLARKIQSFINELTEQCQKEGVHLNMIKDPGDRELNRLAASVLRSVGYHYYTTAGEVRV